MHYALKVHNALVDLSARIRNKLGKCTYVFYEHNSFSSLFRKKLRGKDRRCKVFCEIPIPNMSSDFIIKYHEEFHPLTELKAVNQDVH